MTEALGAKLRKRRLKLGLTLDDLSGRTGISKPYLSLIETGRLANPPSDEKLLRLEQMLGFPNGELLGPAHLHRTPPDVRAMLRTLLTKTAVGVDGTPRANLAAGKATGTDLDDAYLSGMLQDWVEQNASNVETVRTRPVPVINRVSAGYPSDFTDLSYPPRVADEYVGCPEVSDKDAFAARVHGDSMMPKYRPGDIVIFSPAAAPKAGDDCFVRFADGQTTFKRVFFENDEQGQAVIRLQPRNERYRPQSLPAEQISGLYKAIYRYQKVDED